YLLDENRPRFMGTVGVPGSGTPTVPMKRGRLPSKRYTAIERWPSLAFLSGFGPTMKDAVATNLHLKCCPARPPAYAAFRFLQTKPSARDSCMAFTKARFAFDVMAVSQTRRASSTPRNTRPRRA